MMERSKRLLIRLPRSVGRYTRPPAPAGGRTIKEAQYLLNKLLESAMIEMRKQEQAELPARQKKVYEVEEDDD